MHKLHLLSPVLVPDGVRDRGCRSGAQVQRVWQFWLVLVFYTGCVSNAVRLNQQGIELAQSGKYEQAISVFEASIAEEPKEVTPYLNLVRTYLLLKKPQEALPTAQKASELEPTSMEAQLLLAQTHFMLHGYEAAKKIIEQLAVKYPENYLLFMAIGDIALASREWDAAIEYYNKAILVEAQADRAYLQSGRAHLWKEMERLQKKSTEMPIFQDPQKGLVHMANLLASGGLNLDRATACFRKAVYINYQNIEARIMLGIIAFQRTEYQQASLEWEEALRMDPENVFLHMALGLNCQHSRQYEKAAEYFGRARELAPTSVQPVILEILLHVVTQKYVQAVHNTLKEKTQFPDLEQELFQIFSYDKLNHIPWLISAVGNEDQQLSQFSARALTYVSSQPYNESRKYWQDWWKAEQRQFQEHLKNMWKQSPHPQS